MATRLAPLQPSRADKPLYTRWWLWFLIAVVIVAAAFAGSGGEGDTSTDRPPGGELAGELQAEDSTETPGTSAPALEPDRADGEPAKPLPVEPQYPGVGQTVAWRDASTTGTITVNGVRRIPTAEGPNGETPIHGSFLVADVALTVDVGDGSADPLAFRVIGPGGTSYRAESGVASNQIDSGAVVVGEQVTGELAFDVPEGQPLLMEYGVSGEPLATFQIEPPT